MSVNSTCPPDDSSSMATPADTGTTSTSGINVDVNASPIADAHVSVPNVDLGLPSVDANANVGTPGADLGLPNVDANANVLGSVVHASLATPHAFSLASTGTDAPIGVDAHVGLPDTDAHVSLPGADANVSLASLGSGDCSDTSAYSADSSSAIAVHADVPDLGISAHVDADPSIALPDTGLLDVGHVLSSDTSHAC
jgi:hypothetical protein